MKTCPTCQRTFEDTMRFCQADGTPLADEAPAVDPYKTMVASSGDLASAMSGQAQDPESVAKIDHDVLQLPENDPKKTMYASEEEIRREMEKLDEPVVDLPPLSPEPLRPAEPDLGAPSFGDMAPASPPPSPFAGSGNLGGEPPFSRTTPPIPSPFENPKPSTYEAPTQYKPAPEPFNAPGAFQYESAAPIEPAPRPAAQSWQPNEPMQNAPMAAGQNKTLAIVSLVLGILSIPCCGVLTGIPAVIVGFIAKNKISSNPSEYGGAGLALGGIITGIVGTIVGIILLIVQIFLGGLNALMNIPN